MEQRNLGKSEIKVSVLGLGAAHIGAESVEDEAAGKLLNGALDEGVTLIDTARGYHLSEERIGRYLSHRRSEFVLSSKCGYGVEGTEDWTAECVRLGIDRALSLMNTDYIDVMHLHSCPLAVLQQGEVIEALNAAKEAGKIRLAAYSGENEERRFAIECGQFDVIQTSVNICDQRVLDEDLPAAQQAGIGVIAKRPAANVFWRFEERPSGEYCAPYWDRARAMHLDPEPFGWLEMALRFAAYCDGVHSIIAGTANLEHLKENVKILGEGRLPEGKILEIREVFRRCDMDWTGQI